MHRLVFVAAISLVVLGNTGSVEAQSLSQRERQTQALERLEYQASDLPNKCGTEITLEVDWDTFEDADYDDRKSIVSFCEGPISALRQICSSDVGQEVVQQSIGTLVCARGDGLGASVEEGTYRHTFDWDSSNIYYWHLEFMQDNL